MIKHNICFYGDLMKIIFQIIVKYPHLFFWTSGITLWDFGTLFILRKLILQTRMRSHPVGLDVWFLIGPFVYFHTSWRQTAKALARQCWCTGLPEILLVAYVISTIISWAGWLVFKSGRGNILNKVCWYSVWLNFVLETCCSLMAP